MARELFWVWYTLVAVALIGWGIRFVSRGQRNKVIDANMGWPDRTLTLLSLLLMGWVLLVYVGLVDAVGKPYTFGIDLELAPFGRIAVAFVRVINGLVGFADGQVVFAMLVVDDVAAGQGGFGEVVDQRFLAQVEFVPAGQFVAQYLQIGKGIEEYLFFTRAFGRLGELVHGFLFGTVAGLAGEQQKSRCAAQAGSRYSKTFGHK